MSSDESRAAAERLAARPDGAYYARDKGEAEIRDAVAVARAYLAEHPADDADPVTNEWLRSVGFVQGKMSGDLLCGPIVSMYDAAGRRTLWTVRTYPIPMPAAPATRGDVRRLLAALGVTA